ncbi:MAG: DUF1854 domain-containing protein [Planctomycetia bacterium]|nr:DUF1854 domain-containing protein [Planctomycetia bacterium]
MLSARNTILPKAGNNGSAIPLLTLESAIDLEGNAGPEHLAVDEHKVVVSNGCPEKRREWPWQEVDSFRVDSSLGSCFLQARVSGQWVDILRRPASVDRQTTDALEWLNARCRQKNDSEETAESPAPQESATDGPSGETQTTRTPRRWRTATLFLSVLRPFRGSVLLLVVLSLTAVAIEMIPPLLQRRLVDQVLSPEVAGNPRVTLLFLLLSIVTGLLLARLAGTVIGIWKGRVSSRVGTSMTANLRKDLVQKLNELPLSFYDKNRVGMLMSQVAYDTETLHTLVYHATSGVFLQSLQLLGIGSMLFYLNPKLALFALLPMPLILAGSWYITRFLQPRHHHYWEAVGKQASALTGMLSGMRVVKAFVQEDHETRRFRESSRRLQESRLTVDTSTTTFGALMGLLFAMGALAAWYIGGRDVLSKEMTLGDLIATLTYLTMFYAPLSAMVESTTWFANFFSVSRRICGLLDTPGEHRPAGSAVEIGQIQGGVELKEVSFGYDKSRPVLRDINFTIARGELIGVTGRSGSGKSTLISLIGRLYDADSGQILIDGIDVRQMDPRKLRRHIGVVPQEPFLFRGTVAENLAYGNPAATPEQIMIAAKQGDAHDFIMRMPLGYSTQLGEGGMGLSGGERQRLSIARALLFDPAILLLDEATASVDGESEQAICRAIRTSARRRTTIVISHRLTTLQDADRLLIFDHGRLVEEGTQKELFANGGLQTLLGEFQENRTESEEFASAAGLHAMAGARGMAFQDDGDTVVGTPSSHSERNGSRTMAESENGRGGDNGDDDEDGNSSKGHGLTWLVPGGAMITDSRLSMLRVTIDDQTFDNVYAVRALPARYEEQYISLRCRETSGRERELGVIAALDQWPKDIQDAVRRSLNRRYLLRRIREIRQVRASGNLLTMSVMTEGGLAALRLEKPGEGSQPFGDNGLLLSDAAGSYYVIPDRASLPRHQQRLAQAPATAAKPLFRRLIRRLTPILTHADRRLDWGRSDRGSSDRSRGVMLNL